MTERKKTLRRLLLVEFEGDLAESIEATGLAAAGVIGEINGAFSKWFMASSVRTRDVTYQYVWHGIWHTTLKRWCVDADGEIYHYPTRAVAEAAMGEMHRNMESEGFKRRMEIRPFPLDAL